MAGLTSTAPLAKPKRNIWCSHWRIFPAAFSEPRASTLRTNSTSSGRVMAFTGRDPITGIRSFSKYNLALRAVLCAQRGEL
ncbi:hypothetical protein D9M71_677360 [compost metagenome]